jgi:hypothetical protein
MDEIENLRRAVHRELLDATRYAIPAESDLAELRRDVAHHGVRLAIGVGAGRPTFQVPGSQRLNPVWSAPSTGIRRSGSGWRQRT